jgi:hypothetical protein
MSDPIAKSEEVKHLNGSCLCGSVRFKVDGHMRPIVACHCSQCRKQTSNFLAATNAESQDVTFLETSGLSWYTSSKKAERGFCKQCGSVLFWRRFDSSTLSISAGSLDGETGLFICEHIYVADKPDWYEITDNRPQFQVWR